MTSDINPADLDGPSIDRRTATKILGAAGFTGLAGCLGNEAETDDGEHGDGDETNTDETNVDTDELRGGRLRAGWFTGEIRELYPAFINVGQYFQISANIFNGLVTLEPDLTFRGDLAEDWTVENDGKRMVFDLRDDVTFHNGEQFTAEDVEFTIRHNIEVEAPQAGRLSALEPVDEGGVEVIDDYTVALNWEEPTASAFAHLARGPGRAATIINQTALEEKGREQYSLEPVGTGPYQVTEHEVGSHITLDAFDDYFETDENGESLPYLDGIDIEMIPEPGTLVNALRSGDIDFANRVPLENVSEVDGAQGVEISGKVGNGWLGVAMNETRDPFDQVEVRQGIAKAIDNEEVLSNAYFDRGDAAVGVLGPQPEWVARSDEEKDQTQAYAPDEAEELLEGTGVYDETLKILQTAEDQRAARVVRNQLEGVDLNVEIDQVTASTYWDRYADLDYDMTVSGSVQKPEPEESMWNFYRLPDEDGVWNWVNYENEEIHELLAEQRQTTDREERIEVLHEIEDQLIRDVPHAYLVHTEDIAGSRDSVNGFTHIPSFLRNFHEVWLDE